MKLFSLNDNLEYKEVTKYYIKFSITLIYIAIATALSVSIGYISGVHDVKERLVVDTVCVNKTDTLQESANKFTRQEFADLLYNCNVKYPHIVMAQAIIESGTFTSSIFKKNNNMFGMRMPRTRSTTAIGERNGFAYYNTWKDCVYDYALYQSQAMRTCDNEEEYYQALEERYAQDTAYVPALKLTIKNQNLKSLFYE